MRYIYLLFCFVFFIEIGSYAGELKGNKLVLGSYATFAEAKKVLAVTGEALTPSQMNLLEKYHSSLLARPSGKGYILVIEPLANKKEAQEIKKHFSAAFPDAYISGYFGPTQESVFWKLLADANKATKIESHNTSLVHSPIQQAVPVKATCSVGIAWWWMASTGILAITVVFMVILKSKKKKETLCAPAHRGIEGKKKPHKDEDGAPLRLWDYDEALHRTGGDHELLSQRMQTFVAKSPTIIAHLKESIVHKEWSDIIAQACLLKSLSADVAAAALRVMGRRLEGAARDKDGSLADISAAQCGHILKDTLASIQAHIAQEKKGIKITQESCSPSDISDLVMLRTYLEKSLFVDIDNASVFEYYANGSRADEIQELKSAVNKLDYVKALQLLHLIEEGLK